MNLSSADFFNLEGSKFYKIWEGLTIWIQRDKGLQPFQDNKLRFSSIWKLFAMEKINVDHMMGFVENLKKILWASYTISLSSSNRVCPARVAQW